MAEPAQTKRHLRDVSNTLERRRRSDPSVATIFPARKRTEPEGPATRNSKRVRGTQQVSQTKIPIQPRAKPLSQSQSGQRRRRTSVPAETAGSRKSSSSRDLDDAAEEMNSLDAMLNEAIAKTVSEKDRIVARALSDSGNWLERSDKIKALPATQERTKLLEKIVVYRSFLASLASLESLNVEASTAVYPCPPAETRRRSMDNGKIAGTRRTRSSLLLEGRNRRVDTGLEEFSTMAQPEEVDIKARRLVPSNKVGRRSNSSLSSAVELPGEPSVVPDIMHPATSVRKQGPWMLMGFMPSILFPLLNLKEIINFRLVCRKWEAQFKSARMDPQLQVSEPALMLRKRELENKIADYSKLQTELTSKMRAILIEWMADLIVEFEHSPETLHLAIQILDRYLTSVPVERGKLQLLGCTALLLAAKVEEITPPRLETLIYLCDRIYNKPTITKMETKILDLFNFRIRGPSSYTFICMLAQRFSLPLSTLQLATGIAGIVVQEFSINFYLPSAIATAVIIVAVLLDEESTNTLPPPGPVGTQIPPPPLQRPSLPGPPLNKPSATNLAEWQGYSLADILPIIKRVVSCLNNFMQAREEGDHLVRGHTERRMHLYNVYNHYLMRSGARLDLKFPRSLLSVLEFEAAKHGPKHGSLGSFLSASSSTATTNAASATSSSSVPYIGGSYFTKHRQHTATVAAAYPLADVVEPDRPITVVAAAIQEQPMVDPYDEPDGDGDEGDEGDEF